MFARRTFDSLGTEHYKHHACSLSSPLPDGVAGDRWTRRATQEDAWQRAVEERSVRVAEQLQARPVGVGDRDEARVGATEDELVALAVLPYDAHAAAVVVDGDHRAVLRITSKVLDARAGANAREGSRWTEHHRDGRYSNEDQRDTEVRGLREPMVTVISAESRRQAPAFARPGSIRGALPDRLLDLAALGGERPRVGGATSATDGTVFDQAEPRETSEQL